MKNNNSEKELITLVVPVYNAENYLEECVNSILNQDYKNIEIILINDGSKDKSGEIIEKLSKVDNRIKVIHKENSGVSATRNIGIENSKGNYICFIDADDYLSTNYVSYLYKLIKENNAEISLTPFPRKFNSLTDKKTENNLKEDVIEVWSGEKAAIQMLYYNIVISPWNKMISKKLIDKFNLRFNTKLAFGEGFNFSVDCFQRANKVAVGHLNVYNYRVDNPNSAMTTFSIRLVNGSLEAQRTIKENLVNETPKILKACRYANWHTSCDCLNTMIGCKVEKKYKEKYKEIKKICRKDALCTVMSPISFQDKIKGILYFINPYITAKMINHFRLRKFTVQ